MVSVGAFFAKMPLYNQAFSTKTSTDFLLSSLIILKEKLPATASSPLSANQRPHPVGEAIMSRVTWFTGRARTWFTHLQPSDRPVNKLSINSRKLGNDEIAIACIE